jgi:hypothetical protein
VTEQLGRNVLAERVPHFLRGQAAHLEPSPVL